MISTNPYLVGKILNDAGLPSPSPAPSLLTCRSLQARRWPALLDKVVQSSCLMAYEINKWAFDAQSHLMTSKPADTCGSLRQQGSKAARQQGSKAARQQGSKAARQLWKEATASVQVKV
ncbi:hypothetical protein E5E96_17825 [Aeromonas sp. 1805]|uniref:hypothetical protein n=1 Tax=Aeromonas sp. 1805 TaxID=2560028 RepID=UPI00148B0732|nr:hypothetical protein [Aeromonas sp. 1805]QJT18968.1 hypothetical protein E5E96_17825 [Aeromonas sp. 1805]